MAMTKTKKPSRWTILAAGALLLALAAACNGTAGQGAAASRNTTLDQPSCPQPGQLPFTGKVERRGQVYVLLVPGRSAPLPVHSTAQNEAAAPRSPDLSAQVGKQVTICGSFDGAALYEATLVP